MPKEMNMTQADMDRQDEVCTEPAGRDWIDEVQMFAHEIYIEEIGQCPLCGEEL